MDRRAPEEKPPVFNYAIWLYDMNVDDVFDKTRHLILDSSLGVVEEGGDAVLPGTSSPPATH